MEIKTKDYGIIYNAAAVTVTLSGVLRLCDTIEYAPISQLLNEVVATMPETLIIDIQALKFLNSAGINTLYHFVFKLCDQATNPVIVRGSQQITWQTKSLPTLQRLAPDIKLELV